MDWKVVGKGILIADVILVNTCLGFLVYREFINTTPVPPPNLGGVIKEGGTVRDVCGDQCQKYIDDKFKIWDLRFTNLEAGASAIPLPSVTTVPSKSGVLAKPKTKVRTVQYVTVPGSGTSGQFEWQDLPGTEFYFDIKDYSGLVEAYFEASISLFNGNGMAYMRLFDVTHGIGVQGSGVETTSQATTIAASGKLSFWAGKNLYRVQAKTLTSDTSVFSYGRLRIVTEN